MDFRLELQYPKAYQRNQPFFTLFRIFLSIELELLVISIKIFRFTFRHPIHLSRLTFLPQVTSFSLSYLKFNLFLLIIFKTVDSFQFFFNLKFLIISHGSYLFSQNLWFFFHIQNELIFFSGWTTELPVLWNMGLERRPKQEVTMSLQLLYTSWATRLCSGFLLSALSLYFYFSLSPCISVFLSLPSITPEHNLTLNMPASQPLSLSLTLALSLSR